MTNPEAQGFAADENGIIRLSAVSGYEDLPTLQVSLETRGEVFVQPAGAVIGDELARAGAEIDRSAENTGRWGIGIEFGLVSGVEVVPVIDETLLVAAAVAVGAGHGAAGVHKPMGVISHAGAVAFGVHKPQ
jgi:hypothetical protein